MVLRFSEIKGKGTLSVSLFYTEHSLPVLPLLFLAPTRALRVLWVVRTVRATVAVKGTELVVTLRTNPLDHLLPTSLTDRPLVEVLNRVLCHLTTALTLRVRHFLSLDWFSQWTDTERLEARSYFLMNSDSFCSVGYFFKVY